MSSVPETFVEIICFKVFKITFEFGMPNAPSTDERKEHAMDNG